MTWWVRKMPIRGRGDEHHDYGPEDHHRKIHLFGAVRLVAQSEDETREEDAEIDPFENDAEYGTGSKVHFRLAETSRQNSKDEEEVCLRVLPPEA